MTDVPNHSRSRRGVGVVELMAGMAMMTTTIVLVAQVYVLVERASRIAERRQIAAVAAANVMERVAGVPWDQLDQSVVEDWQLPPDARSSLPRSTLKIQITTHQDALAAKRVEVEVSWSETHGTQTSWTRLVTWRYNIPETRP